MRTVPAPARTARTAELLAVLAVLAAVGAHVMTGALRVDWAQVLPTVGRDTDLSALLVEARLGRAVCGVLAGAALAMSGLLLQQATRNPLAGPSLTGVTGGASLAVLVLLLLVPTAGVGARPLAGVLGAGLALGTVLLLSGSVGRSAAGPAGQGPGAGPLRLALVGVVVAAALGAVRSALLLSAGSEQVSATLSFWLVGSLVGRSLADAAGSAGPILASVAAAGLLRRRRQLLLLDDAAAAGLGLHPRASRVLVLAVAAVAAASATVLAGPVAVVGLVCPHLARLLLPAGRDPLLLSVLLGSGLLCWADLAARALLAPAELPVGGITGLLIGPAVVFVLARGGLR